MFGLALRSPQRRATSSGSMSLNSPFVPSHIINSALDESASSSNKNCHNWICPDPCETSLCDAAFSSWYGSEKLCFLLFFGLCVGFIWFSLFFFCRKKSFKRNKFRVWQIRSLLPSRPIYFIETNRDISLIHYCSANGSYACNTFFAEMISIGTELVVRDRQNAIWIGIAPAPRQISHRQWGTSLFSFQIYRNESFHATLSLAHALKLELSVSHFRRSRCSSEFKKCANTVIEHRHRRWSMRVHMVLRMMMMLNPSGKSSI